MVMPRSTLNKPRQFRELTAVLVLALFLAAPALANDLVLSTPSLASKNVPAVGGWDIQFNVAWSHSWCDANAACMGGVQQPYANWDAVWAFAKFTKWLPNGSKWDDWKHCTIDPVNGTPALVQPTGSQAVVGCTNSTTTEPSVDCSLAGAVGKGVFVYRNAEGTGPNSWTGVKMRWNYTADGVSNEDAVKVKVFGVEMVYVPTGAFKAGDYGTSDGSFQQGQTITNPWEITSEAQITTTTVDTGIYYYRLGTGGGTGASATNSVFTIPAAFPKGYKAFYMMKYELSQGMYRDFLNVLTRAQQVSRTASVVAGTYAMSGLGTVSYRSGIRVQVSPAVLPITVGCDLSVDGIYNGETDGEWIAANYLSWGDGAAFADWAGLRPFTELEFEKAARGPQLPIAGEYAWGNATLVNAVTLTDGGKKSEVPLTLAGANGLVSGGLAGPIRTGAFALTSTGALTRAAAGASYYGVMELSGNLWERPVTVGHATGRSFTGIHGDGLLAAAFPTGWPTDAAAQGVGLRGGAWYYAATYARVSDRYFAAIADTNRYYSYYGARCARTSP